MTKDSLIELGWKVGHFKDHSYMHKGELVLINYAGVWALGRLISGEPFMPLNHPIYVRNEEELSKLLN